MKWLESFLLDEMTGDKEWINCMSFSPIIQTSQGSHYKVDRQTHGSVKQWNQADCRPLSRKEVWCDYRHMKLVGSKCIRSLLSGRELCCQINRESAFKKLLTFWGLQLLGPQCSMRKKVAEKIRAAPKESMFPSTHFRGAKENNGKEGRSRREELAAMEYKQSAAAPKAQHGGRIHEHPPQEREEGFPHCWVSSVFPFPSKNECHTILPLSTNVYPTEVGRP